jgi:hypothetical protein
MSSFIKKTKKKTKTIQDLTEDETQLVLKDINTAKLDKEYVMSEINKYAEKKFINLTFVDESDTPIIQPKPAPQKSGGFLKKPLLAPPQPTDPIIEPVTRIAESIEPLKEKEESLKPVKKTKVVEEVGTEGKKKSLFKSSLKNITTHLGEIGISNEQKPKVYETMIKTEHLTVKMYSCCNEQNQKKEIPSKTDINCWWCRYPIPEDIHPLGCPVKFVKKDIAKGIDNEYFETDGIFCSFNCVLAYVNLEMRYNIRYRESGCLIYLLYKMLFGQEYVNVTINPAVDWRLLKKYGGCFSISEFRTKFQTVSHMTMNLVKSDRKIEKNPLSPTNWQYVEEENNKKLY